MLITSHKQLDNLVNPPLPIDIAEFEEITLKFGSFLCISKNKKLNFLNFLKTTIEDKKIQKLYCLMLEENNFQYIIKTYIESTPSFYKKIFRAKNINK